MPNNQWFSFKDYAGTGSINAFKGTIDDEIDVAAQLNVGTIEADSDAGAIALFDMPVSSSSADGTEMSATIRIDGNDILKVYAESNGAGGADSFAVKLLSGAGLDITEIAATSDTDKFLVSDSNRVKYRTGSEVLSDIGGQASLGFTPENVVNKRTSFQATPTDTAYISEKLAKDSLDAKENLANKKTTITDSDDDYPTCKAVKTAVDAKMANPMTTQGDIIYGGYSGTPTRLSKGTAGQVLTMNSGATAPQWSNPTAGGISWSAVTTDTTMAIDTGSLANKGTLLTLTLPATSAVGKTVRVAGMNAGLWKIAQGANQYIKFGNLSTTTGTGGSLSSTQAYDAVELVCIEADKGWVVVSSIGNITIV